MISLKERLPSYKVVPFMNCRPALNVNERVIELMSSSRSKRYKTDSVFISILLVVPVRRCLGFLKDRMVLSKSRMDLLWPNPSALSRKYGINPSKTSVQTSPNRSAFSSKKQSVVPSKTESKGWSCSVQTIKLIHPKQSSTLLHLNHIAYPTKTEAKVIVFFLSKSQCISI